MERITVRSAKGLKLRKGKKFVELLSDKSLTLQALNRLAELEDKLESGELMKLPCKLGENFVIKDYGFNRLRVEQERIVGYNFSQFESTIYPVDQYGYYYSPDKVFSTKEQAEARLKELQEKL